MKLNAWHKIKLLHLASHCISAIGLVLFWDPVLFGLSILTGYFFYLFGGTIGFHRLWSHNAFKTSKFIKYATLVVGTLMGHGSVVGWVGQHRQHHKYSDVSKELDPYWAHESYSFWGTIKCWALNPAPTAFSFSMVKDLKRDKFAWFTHQHYFKIILIWILFLSLIDFKIALYFWFIPNVICYINGQITAAFGHRIGKTNHFDTDDLSKDCHWLNIFSLGESYQNSHHKFPSKIKLGKYDLTGIIIEKFLIR